ncbi:KaiB domain protein [Calothrix parasitica NIES-267]|uniref:KaiB domain protein n=1 Tax=Calothrix parasitica NIES-267 TaxID=1973488 RepID=A0A1Z4LHA5_9CYAN|nr:KaiB domain protein [Calothrix parasitica NIES-267]
MCKSRLDSKHVLKLYVTGDTVRSDRAIFNLEKLCQENFLDEYKIHIIDVLKQPDIAEKEKIIVTPTLIRESPLPQVRIIGDLSDIKTVLMGLGINTRKHDIFSE